MAPELTAPLGWPQALAEAGANVDYVCPRNGVAIVHGASTRRRNCRLGSLLASTEYRRLRSVAAANYGFGNNLVEVLHKHGANLDAQDQFGYTAMHCCKTARAAKMLCACGAEYTKVDKSGNTPVQHHLRNPQNGDAVIVAGLLEEYVRKLKEFELFDIDGDGNLTEEELETGLRQRNMSDKEIRQMWNRLEHNEQGGIGEREYALMSIRTEQQTE